MKPRALAALVFAWLGAPRIAAAEPIRLVVSVGHKMGLPAERPLQYADNDATRVRDVLVSLGGVRREHAFLLQNPTRNELYATIDRARAAAVKHRPEEVTLVFYFSGHGDREALHLGDERVHFGDLSTKLGEVPAGLRIAVTDACRASREKGFVADEPFAIHAATLPQATGQVWLHASSEGEAAQESNELQGAIFTHAWLNGLRGAADANGDARVTLDESFAFAHSQTLIRSANSSGVIQKPEAVVSLRESAPVVLTQTAPRMATLSLPQAPDAHFLVYTAGSRSVLSEIWGLPNRRAVLRVPPGRYVIQRRVRGAGAAAQIAMTEGEERQLDERDFSATTLDAIAQKGVDHAVDAPPPNLSHEVSAGYAAGVDTRTGVFQGPRLQYAFAGRYVALTVGGGIDWASRSLEAADEKLMTSFGRASVEGRLPLGVVTLRGGGGGRAGWLVQTIDERTPSPSTKNNGAFVYGPEVYLGARTRITPWSFLDMVALGNLMVVREEDKARVIPAVSGTASLGASF